MIDIDGVEVILTSTYDKAYWINRLKKLANDVNESNTQYYNQAYSIVLSKEMTPDEKYTELVNVIIMLSKALDRFVEPYCLR